MKVTVLATRSLAPVQHTCPTRKKYQPTKTRENSQGKHAMACKKVWKKETKWLVDS